MWSTSLTKFAQRRSWIQLASPLPKNRHPPGHLKLIVRKIVTGLGHGEAQRVNDLVAQRFYALFWLEMRFMPENIPQTSGLLGLLSDPKMFGNCDSGGAGLSPRCGA